MIRVGLISDIHGNLPALDAVLAELERERVDSIVCLGDVAAGPQAHETLARLRALGCPVVLGNWDAWFLAPPPAPPDGVELLLHELTAFWARELTADDLDYLHGFRPTLDLALAGGESALCFHGSPRSYDDFIFSTTPDAELAGVLEGVAATVLLGGHTHVQLVRRVDAALLVNPGSVGLPFAAWWPRDVRVARRAEYGVLSSGDGGRLHVELRRTGYDVGAFLAAALESGMPHAEWWVETWDDGPANVICKQEFPGRKA